MWLLPPSVTQRADLSLLSTTSDHLIGLSIPQYSHIQNENNVGSHQGGHGMRCRMPVWRTSTWHVASTQKYHSISHYYYLLFLYQMLLLVVQCVMCVCMYVVCVYICVLVYLCVHACVRTCVGQVYITWRPEADSRCLLHHS